MTTRRDFLAAASSALLAPAAERRPNLIVFMTDDHGAWATGAYGCSEISTPHIDGLAKTGMRFTQAFAATPVCSPSRLTYMTGKMPSQHGVQDWLRPEDSFGADTRRWLAGHTTYARLLAEAGYRTGMVGKWHMGDDEKAQEGFQYWATVPGGGGPFKDVEFVKNGQKVRVPGFKEDFIGDCALDFLSQSSTQPFFLLVPFYAPHTPYTYQPDQDRAPYKNSAFSCFPRTPRHPWQTQTNKQYHLEQEAMRSYSALITAADRNVGRVLQFLDDEKLRQNTSVVFTADQGWNAGHHGVWGKGNGTWPFNMYEESIRVPLIWNHPGRIKPGTADPMISSYDFFPTILDWCGVAAPADSSRPGRSYANSLRGQRQEERRDRLYFEYSFVRSVRTENSKLIERTLEWPTEFFDLKADPGELTNKLADPSKAREVAALRDDLHTWFAKIGAPPLSEWRGTTRQNLTKYTRD